MRFACGQQDQSLSPGCTLGDYVIRKRIGGGGFSIVYLGERRETGEPVVLKEYMPLKLARRDTDSDAIRCKGAEASGPFCEGRRLFLQEARVLTGLQHPNIVRVIGFFRENGTAYMVMAYEKGTTLQTYIGRKGNLSERLLRTVFPPLLDGLRNVHDNGLLHLDIKPGNVYLRPGGNPLLLDFGAAHHMWRSRRYRTSQVITPGFAPVEQLRQEGYIGPWTDVYAIGATMRACIEGSPPPAADVRRTRDRMKPASTLFKRRYSQPLLNAIDWAMEVEPLHRPQSVDELVRALGDGEPAEKEEETGVLERITSSFSWLKS